MRYNERWDNGICYKRFHHRWNHETSQVRTVNDTSLILRHLIGFPLSKPGRLQPDNSGVISQALLSVASRWDPIYTCLHKLIQTRLFSYVTKAQTYTIGQESSSQFLSLDDILEIRIAIIPTTSILLEPTQLLLAVKIPEVRALDRHQDPSGDEHTHNDCMSFLVDWRFFRLVDECCGKPYINIVRNVKWC